MSAVSSDNLFFLPLTPPARGRGESSASAPRSVDQPVSADGLELFVGDAANQGLKILQDLSLFPPQFWPLVLFGPTGCGKTRLAATVADRLSREIAADADSGWSGTDGSAKKVLLLSAPDFVRGIAHAIQTKSMESFVDRLLSHPVIVWDNLEYLAKSPASQSELVVILERCAELGTRVIVTLQQAPEYVSGLTPALLSRLNHGLSLPVELPGLSARKHLVEILSRKVGLELSPAQILELAKQNPLSVPQLHRVLWETRQLAVAGNSVSSGLPMSTAAPRLPTGLPPEAKFDVLLQRVAHEFQLTPAALLSPSRKQSLVAARNLLIHLGRELFHFSFCWLGTHLGGRDHSTIMHGHQKFQTALAGDPDLARRYAAIKHQILQDLTLQDFASRTGNAATAGSSATSISGGREGSLTDGRGN